jgi:hypothetical protein
MTTKTIDIGGRKYRVRTPSVQEFMFMREHMSLFSVLTSPPGPRTLAGKPHFHFGWDFANPNEVFLKTDRWLIYDPVAFPGYGLTVVIRGVLDVWICHLRGFVEEVNGLRLIRGGQKGLRSAGYTTGPHWHVHFTPPGEVAVYILPGEVLDQT